MPSSFYMKCGEKRAEEILCCEPRGLIDGVSSLAASQPFLPVIETQPGPPFSRPSMHLMTESIGKTAAHPSVHLVHPPVRPLRHPSRFFILLPR